jgi:hypothetical protein
MANKNNAEPSSRLEKYLHPNRRVQPYWHLMRGYRNVFATRLADRTALQSPDPALLRQVRLWTIRLSLPLGCLLTQPVRFFIDAHFHSKVLGGIAAAIVVCIASILVALLSYHFCESLFLKLKKHFTYRKSAATADRRAALNTA